MTSPVIGSKDPFKINNNYEICSEENMSNSVLIRVKDNNILIILIVKIINLKNTNRVLLCFMERVYGA